MEASMRSRRTCLMVALAALATGCATSVGLMPAPETAPAAASGAVNRPPSAKIETSADRASGSGPTYPLRVNAYDPDGDELTIEWSATEGTFTSSTTTRTTWTPGEATTTATITVKVTDSSGATASDTTTIVVSRTP
jgi:hypothetical protein